AVLIRLVIGVVQIYAPDKLHGVEIGLILYSAIILAVHILTLKIAAR
ncbi:MAG: hypothetical protein QOD25_1321, partial [Alphaproteobacteria bacterium]|nr:hypothetical protein [Alphaproteobacteria bacterium]